MCFFAFFGAKIWPAAAGTGELARDLRDQTLSQGETQRARVSKREGEPKDARGGLICAYAYSDTSALDKYRSI